MVVGKNKGLNKAGKKGGKKKVYVGHVYLNRCAASWPYGRSKGPIKSDLMTLSEATHRSIVKNFFHHIDF